jgi:hypothetical protein
MLKAEASRIEQQMDMSLRLVGQTASPAVPGSNLSHR